MMSEDKLRKIILEEMEMMGHYLDEGAIKDFLSKINIKQLVKKKAEDLRAAIGRARIENVIAARIILNAIKEQKLTSQEAKFLKEKGVDFVKVINLLGFQFIPGGNMLLQIANAILKKYDIYIFPQGREVPDQYKDYKDQKLAQKKKAA